MGPDGYSKSKQVDNEADGLSLAKELIRTAAICIQNFQRQQKPKPEPTRIQKYLIDFGIIEGNISEFLENVPEFPFRYCQDRKRKGNRKNNN